jgi:hypothetical protein
MAAEIQLSGVIAPLKLDDVSLVFLDQSARHAKINSVQRSTWAASRLV